MQSSGKLVIFGIVGVALAAAGASWWYRYSATRRAAEFWGARAVQLIRDAPVVELLRLAKPEHPDQPGEFLIEKYDISAARGLTHLRNALLEDRNFTWPGTDELPPGECEWILQFRDAPGESAPPLMICYFSDCRLAMRVLANDDTRKTISCETIAAGLREMFAEMLAISASEQR
jgi:hypothetical protein